MGEWLQLGPAANRAYLALPISGAGAGMLVIHAWWGLTSDITEVCDRLAAAGFVALAPSLYPDGATAATIAEAEALRDTLDSAAGEAVVQAALDHLRDSPAVTSDRLAVIGFSLGASWALDLSRVRPDEISAVVAIYGTDDGDYTTSQAAYLLHFAEHDEYEPLELVRSLETRIRNAGRDVDVHIYPGTGHWFVESSRSDVYNAAAADLVWERTVAFLQARLADDSAFRIEAAAG